VGLLETDMTVRAGARLASESFDVTAMARRYAELDYADLLRDQLKVLDAAAVSLCMENDLPIVVFDLNQPDNITRVAAGEPVGTLISGADGADGGATE